MEIFFTFKVSHTCSWVYVFITFLTLTLKIFIDGSLAVYNGVHYVVLGSMSAFYFLFFSLLAILVI